jgi:hypothetical protein
MSQILHTWELALEQGKRDERERIIALIESSQVGGYDDANYIVALIKGENE